MYFKIRTKEVEVLFWWGVSTLHTTSEFWLENYTTSDKVKKDLYRVFIITDSITVIGKTLFK